jgi:hypothetical protein
MVIFRVCVVVGKVIVVDEAIVAGSVVGDNGEI